MPDSIAPVVNRRASCRRSAKKSAVVTCQKGTLGLGPNLALSVLDVSETGVRLMSREALRADETVLITLQSVSQRRSHQCPGAVVWCVQAAGGGFCTGVRFGKPLAFGDLHALAYV